MIRAIIFDCFGVLYVDVNHAYFSQFPELREELYDLNKQADHGFVDRETYTKTVAKLTGVSEEETARAFMKEHTVNRALIEYIRMTLKSHYKVGLVSNIGRDWMQDFFDKHALHDLFDVAVLSSEEGITKPNPLIFERAAERLEVFVDEVIFVDDRQENCDGAVAAGMRSVLYTSLEDLKESLKKEFS